MCGNPHEGRGRGEYVLTAMKALSPNLREELVDLWDAVIPKLLTYLSGELCTGTLLYSLMMLMLLQITLHHLVTGTSVIGRISCLRYTCTTTPHYTAIAKIPELYSKFPLLAKPGQAGPEKSVVK